MKIHIGILSLGIWMPAAFAQQTLHPDGFAETPSCSKPSFVKKSLEKHGEIATGFVATSPRFELEIYAVPTSSNEVIKNWTLIGDNRQGQLCRLATSETRSFTQDEWFRRYFGPQLKPSNPSK